MRHHPTMGISHFLRERCPIPPVIPGNEMLSYHFLSLLTYFHIRFIDSLPRGEFIEHLFLYYH